MTWVDPASQVMPCQLHSVPGALNVGVPLGGQGPLHHWSLLVQPPPPVHCP